jgi:hypothetical protein
MVDAARLMANAVGLLGSSGFCERGVGVDAGRSNPSF